MSEAANLPVSGPLPRPSSLEEAFKTLKAERIGVRHVQAIRFKCDEFTSVCPRTGQPDFGTVEIHISPDNYGIESKALKFYLWAFREEGMFCEQLAARIADDVFESIEPRHCLVRVTQNPRGGIGLEVEALRVRGQGGN